MNSFKSTRFLFIAIIGVTLFANKTTAQFSEMTGSKDNAITSYGTAIVTCQPEILRMQIELVAKGKDLAAALAKLNDIKDAARAQVEKLGAIPASISMGTPKSGTPDDRQKQMQMMVREQLKAGKKKGSNKPASSTVSVTLKAEWALKAEKPEDLFVKASELQDKIKGADLAAAKEKKEDSEEEEEESDESSQAARMYSGMYGGEGLATPGVPSFVFVTKVPEADRAKATKEAFDKAKSKAENLASATGIKLGTLRSLSCTASGGESDNPYNSMRFFVSGSRSGEAQSNTDDCEATSPRFGDLTYRIMINASFTIDQKSAG